MSSGTIAIAVAIMMALGAGIPAISQGLVASKAMEAIARQPEAAGQVRSTMILALGLIEALTIYCLLIGFMLVGKI